MAYSGTVVRVALPAPLHRCFDYLPPANPEFRLEPGVRVRVPWGRRERVGILVAVAEGSLLPAERLRPLHGVLDPQPLLPPALLELGLWAARYYLHPPGEALQAFLPGPLRRGQPLPSDGIAAWRLADPEGRTGAPRGPRQQALVALLADHREGLSAEELVTLGFSREVLRRARDRGFIEALTLAPPRVLEGSGERTPALALAPQQAEAMAAISRCRGAFKVLLLQGVTGSGKTEVYLQAIAEVIERGQQALVLVPEIGLTPQTFSRFRERFNRPVVMLHSGLSEGERLQAWQAAREGRAAVIIGTRSAVLTPMASPGILVVDEEHDASFKQQDGFRYSARDLAVMRGRREDIPVVLGSATPSLESLENARRGRYQWLRLDQRAGGARPVDFELLDVRRLPMTDGLSEPLAARIRQHLEAGNQVLVFLNRRGFAPTLMCHDCGWTADCRHCDAHLRLHREPPSLLCHHCELEAAVPARCPRCQSPQLTALGAGTERVEATLKHLFRPYPVVRIDRDSTRRKGALEKLLEQAQSGEPGILLGTQMLAKGHHLPAVTLVAILDADAGLFSPDFRGLEKMAQLVLQVAGRAGRADRPGTLVMQTHQADHPELLRLLEQGYTAFAEVELRRRRNIGLPPFSHWALVRAEAVAPGRAEALLQWLADKLAPECGPELSLLGPMPAPMERRAGRYRAQLRVQARARGLLQGLLEKAVAALEEQPLARKARWSMDRDPWDLV